MKRLLAVILAVATLATMFCMQIVNTSAMNAGNPKGTGTYFTVTSVTYTSPNTIKQGNSFYTGEIANYSSTDSDRQLRIEFNVSATRSATRGELIIPLDGIYNTSSAYVTSSNPYFKDFSYAKTNDDNTNEQGTLQIKNGPVSGIANTNHYISIPLVKTNDNAESTSNIRVYCGFDYKYVAETPSGVDFFTSFYTAVNGTPDDSREYKLTSYNNGFFDGAAVVKQNDFRISGAIYKGFETQPFSINQSTTKKYSENDYTQVPMNKQRIANNQPVIETELNFPAGVNVELTTDLDKYTLSGSLSQGYKVSGKYYGVELTSQVDSDNLAIPYGTLLTSTNSVFNDVNVSVPLTYTGTSVAITGSIKAYTQEKTETNPISFNLNVLEPRQNLCDNAFSMWDKNIYLNRNDEYANMGEGADRSLLNNGVLPIDDISYTVTNDVNIPATIAGFSNRFVNPAKITVRLTNGSLSRSQIFNSVASNAWINAGSDTQTNSYLHLNSGEWIESIESVPFYTDSDNEIRYGVEGSCRSLVTGDQTPLLLYCVLPNSNINPKTHVVIPEGGYSDLQCVLRYKANYTYGGQNFVDEVNNNTSGVVSETARLNYKKFNAIVNPGSASYNITFKAASISDATVEVGNPVNVALTANLTGTGNWTGFTWNQPIFIVSFPDDVSLNTAKLTKVSDDMYSFGDNDIIKTATRLSEGVWRFTTVSDCVVSRTQSFTQNIPMLVSNDALAGQKDFTVYAYNGLPQNFTPRNTTVTDFNDYNDNGYITDSIPIIGEKTPFSVIPSYNILFTSMYENDQGEFISMPTSGGTSIPVQTTIGGQNRLRTLLECTGNSLVSNIVIFDAFPNFFTGYSEYVNGSIEIIKIDINGIETNITGSADIVANSSTKKLTITLDTSITLSPGEYLRLTRSFKVRTDARPGLNTENATTSISALFAGTADTKTGTQAYQTELAKANVNVKVFLDYNYNGTYESNVDKAVRNASVTTRMTSADDAPFRSTSSINNVIDKFYDSLEYGSYVTAVSDIIDDNNLHMTGTIEKVFDITLAQARSGETVTVLVPISATNVGTVKVKYLVQGDSTIIYESDIDNLSVPKSGTVTFDTTVSALGNGSMYKLAPGQTSSKRYSLTLQSPSGEVIFYVVAVDHNVKYIGNGGVTSANETTLSDVHKYNESVTLRSDSTFKRTGYTFSGWEASVTLSDLVNNTFTMPAMDVTFTAQWTVNSHAVSYNGNGGTKDGSETVADGNYNYDATVAVKDNMFTLEGASFLGWNTKADGTGTNYSAADSFNMPDNDVVLYAQWSVNKYKLSYNGNGVEKDGDATVFDGEYDFGSIVTVKDNMFERTGYTFEGWNTAADGTGTSYSAASALTIPANDVVLYAQWKVNSYTLTYDANGASTSETSVPDGEYSFGSDVTIKDIMFDNIGYNFVGWNTKADGSGDTYLGSDIMKMPANDVTLYAQWSANGYNFIYNGNGGTTNDGKSTFTDGVKDFGTNITVKDNMFSREGYTFTGWNTTADATGVAYKANDTFTMPSENVVLYAQWKANDYELKYNGNGATKDNNTDVSDGKYSFDSSVTVKDNMFSREGYTFLGWNTKADGTGTAYKANDTFKMPARDVTLFAQWNVNAFKLIYNGNNGVANGESTVSGGTFDFAATVTVKDNMFAREGYTFTGWNTKADGTGTAYKANDTFKMPASDTTLYAQWKMSSFTVTYHGNGGKDNAGADTASETATFGSMVTVKNATFAREGYTFICWNTKADGTGKSFAVNDKFEMPATNVDLYAQWKINSYGITYNGNGGADANNNETITDGPFDWNSKVNLSDGIFERDGYIFIGWNTAPDGSGTSYGPNATITLDSGLVLYAIWQKKEAPKTGDATAANAIMAVLLLAAAVATTLVIYNKRKSHAE